MNHVKMSELEEQRSRLACEVECLKAAAKSSTQSEQQWKGFKIYLYISIIIIKTTRLDEASRIAYTRAKTCIKLLVITDALETVDLLHVTYEMCSLSMAIISDTATFASFLTEIGRYLPRPETVP